MRSVHKAVLNAALNLREKPKTILDIGCGNGSFTRVLSDAFPGAAITATDTAYSKHFMNAKNITFAKGSAGFESVNISLVPETMKSLHLVTAKKG